MKNKIKYWFIRMYYRIKGELKYDEYLSKVRTKPGHVMWWVYDKSHEKVFFYVYMGNGYYIKVN